MPEESFLEETYYHRVAPGARLRRCSASTPPTASSTRRVAVGDRDTVLVPARLPHRLGPARLRPLLPERDGRPHARLGHRQRPRPRMDAAMSTATTTATRLLDNYVGGAWTPPPPPRRSTSPTPRPARCSPACRCRRRPTSTPPCSAARAALPEWRAVSVIARARQLFALREGLVARKEDLARSVTTEMGKTIVDARAEVGAHDRDGRGRVRDPDDDAGPHPRGRRRATSTPRRSASRSACARRSCRSTSRRWCRSGSCRSRSRAATRSSSSRPSRCR